MTEISASAIKELREQTGAGMMDCKKALVEAKGDHESAIEWLRKKGLAAASKKAGRIAAEGGVVVKTAASRGVVVELNSETDFVARNERFQALANSIADAALKQNSKTIDELNQVNLPSGKNVAAEIVENISSIGENLNLRRIVSLSVEQGAVVSYVHNAIAPGIGKIGVLVALSSSAPADKLQELGKQLAMHIAASSPQALTAAELDKALVEKEKEIVRAQSKASGKPDNIIEKMVEGRIQKFYGEVVLLEQPFVIDGKTLIRDVLAQASKDFGAPIEIKSYVRMALGEGIEKEATDFAAEVAAVVGG
jgi:elongation factor Ts